MHVQLVGMQEILLVLVQHVDQAFIVLIYHLGRILERVRHSLYIVDNFIKIALVSLRQVLVHSNGKILEEIIKL
jgi:hypothetical protein